MSADTDFDLASAALDYHAHPKPGKLETALTKPTDSQADLSLAYTPGVAEPVKCIAQDPKAADLYTGRRNLVGVISDGTAVLGLGNVGPLASKPVMEGKAVLLKRFADVDVFDIEVRHQGVDDFIRTVENIAPTFGAINLEDIRAPECFEIEEALIKKLDIPVFHDDQHGTAITVAAGLLNALELQSKSLESAKIVVIGAGAAAIATIKMLVTLGAQQTHILAVDRKGVIHTDRDDLNPYKASVAVETDARSIEDALVDADVMIGLAGANSVEPEWTLRMAPKGIVFALSNPDPEVDVQKIQLRRDDWIIATGRSDLPNQVNNVLCFPYIFRAALDGGAQQITDAMKVAATQAIRQLAKQPVPKEVIAAYGDVSHLSFGPDYILPKPLDPRLREFIVPLIMDAV